MEPRAAQRLGQRPSLRWITKYCWLFFSGPLLHTFHLLHILCLFSMFWNLITDALAYINEKKIIKQFIPQILFIHYYWCLHSICVTLKLSYSENDGNLPTKTNKFKLHFSSLIYECVFFGSSKSILIFKCTLFTGRVSTFGACPCS